MLTSALITLVQKEIHDYPRILILSYINEIQKMVFSQNATAQMRIYDPYTGKDPILTTTTSVFEYNISEENGFPNDAWRVYSVYESDIDDPVEDLLTFDATPDIPYARVVFPDLVSGDFYVRCYRFPNELNSEADQLEIPDSYHLTHVYEGIVGLIERTRSGKSERYDVFEKIRLPDLIRKMSDGKRRRSGVTYRPCGV